MKISNFVIYLNKFKNDATFRFNILSNLGFFNLVSDEYYLKTKFKAYFGENLNLNYPTTFNEKLQWLKLNDRKQEHVIMADKFRVRDYIKNKIGDKYLIPLIGTWSNPSEIDFNILPNQFVLKCNHNSGKGMFICKDKSKLSEKDIRKIKKDLAKGLKQNYYMVGREWPYKNIPRLIICEKFMEDVAMKELRDYKFFCFNGVVKCFKVDFNRFIKHRANYYNVDGTLLDCGEAICPPDYNEQLELPKNLKLMINLAEILSKSEKFLRVDFYEVNGEVYFGELTFYPASGFGEFIDKKWDDEFGHWLKL